MMNCCASFDPVHDTGNVGFPCSLESGSTWLEGGTASTVLVQHEGGGEDDVCPSKTIDAQFWMTVPSPRPACGLTVNETLPCPPAGRKPSSELEDSTSPGCPTYVRNNQLKVPV